MVRMESTLPSASTHAIPHSQAIHDAWSWRKCEPGADWQPAILPHHPETADLNGQQNWFGICEYQRELTLPCCSNRESFAIHVGGAMQHTTVYLDDQCIGRHAGGFLPFEIAIPDVFCDGKSHTLRMVLDNRHNPEIPPGKAHDQLDFCWYGGLYRSVCLKHYPGIHITDPLSIPNEAGGGVLLQTLELEGDCAQLGVRVHIQNRHAQPHVLGLRIRVCDASGKCITEHVHPFSVEGEADCVISCSLSVSGIQPWSTEHPTLYAIETSIVDSDGLALDRRTTRFGFRTVCFSRSRGLVINGTRIRPRGTNRHQDHPWVGYALPNAAQYRDALRIKNAGFDYVRLSHYPQAPAFLDACDELGILVMNCIPGWQFIGNHTFREACFQNARDLIRRDRNHACVVLWELSLNETEMDTDFISTMQHIARTEFPGGSITTCGWMKGYDVYIHARQHGRMHTWKNGDQALVISEYGDWEYYAENDGFDQRTGAQLKPSALNSRAFRSDGEAKLRQQLFNHIEALNDTLSSPAALDGQWSMFDYARGYHPVRAACGIADVFRLPKWSYFFYRSQRSLDSVWGEPVLWLATHGTPHSTQPLIALSNLDTVELYLNGALVARSEHGERERWPHLPHPPHLFDLDHLPENAVLEARGYHRSKLFATHQIRPPGAPAQLHIQLDNSPVADPLIEDAYDLIFAHISILDSVGTLCVTCNDTVELHLQGEAQLMSPNPITAEAGIASTLIRIPSSSPGFHLEAKTPLLRGVRPGTLACDLSAMGQR